MKPGIFPVSVSSLALLCLLGAATSAQTEAGVAIFLAWLLKRSILFRSGSSRPPRDLPLRQ